MKYTVIKLLTTEQRFYYQGSSKINIGDLVLINTEHSLELASVINIIDGLKKLNPQNRMDKIEIGQGTILRKVSDIDRKKIINLKNKARTYLAECQKKIKKHNLSMKLLDADLSFDEKKLTFYFGAEGRIDFRSLAQDLIKTFHKTIRLQQIGSRDEAKVFGGFGLCGRQICCASFLNNIESITLDMAKEQNFSSGIGKISGLCGKLMCCLSYELEEYRKLRKNLPEIGKIINTKEGKGKVVDQKILAQKVTVKLAENKFVEVEI